MSQKAAELLEKATPRPEVDHALVPQGSEVVGQARERTLSTHRLPLFLCEGGTEQHVQGLKGVLPAAARLPVHHTGVVEVQAH